MRKVYAFWQSQRGPPKAAAQSVLHTARRHEQDARVCESIWWGCSDAIRGGELCCGLCQMVCMVCFGELVAIHLHGHMQSLSLGAETPVVQPGLSFGILYACLLLTALSSHTSCLCS